MTALGHAPVSPPVDPAAGLPAQPSRPIVLVQDDVYRLPSFTTRTVNGISHNYIPVAALAE